MKLQRTLSCITGVLIAAGFAASQASAGVEPGCPGGAEIEINALRGGSPTVVTNGTKDITSKARIAKGTAVDGSLLRVMLTIEAASASGAVSDPMTAGPMTLSIGKGGTGAKLRMNVPTCSAGEAVFFTATFTGIDAQGNLNPLCSNSRTISKTCN